ncbi:hypothetical protein TSUD_88290 [Trifolium subterraneum]|uniref:Uncharacterized protein n=1 Tax=Trifolium subterraneum TaxID=3900 RepID=A0A2Z6NF78_TRISU|nr:hypothetical protein TSUD_88290 [Trifolium subterraneum]
MGTDSISKIKLWIALSGWIISCLTIVDEFATSLGSGDIGPFHNDPELLTLLMIQEPLVDVEIRGVPAIKFPDDMVWK